MQHLTNFFFSDSYMNIKHNSPTLSMALFSMTKKINSLRNTIKQIEEKGNFPDPGRNTEDKKAEKLKQKNIRKIK